MSIASRTAAGWVSRAAWYQEHGGDINTLLDAWGSYAAGEDSRTLYAIWDAGARARNAGLIAVEDFAGGTVPASLIPGGGPGRVGYRYRVVGTYRPSDGGADVQRTVDIPSAFQLTAAQLRDAADELTPAYNKGETKQKRRLKQGVTYSLQDFEIQSLERWSV